MSVVAFTFGSFGDIITIIQLAHSIQKALSDTRGSAAECRNLIAYLGAYTTTLECVQNAFDSRNTAYAAPLRLAFSGPAANAISRSIAISYDRMKTFERKLECYRESLEGGSSGSWFRDAWRKVNWPTIRQEAVDLQRELTAQAQIINIILTLSARSAHFPNAVAPTLLT